MKWNDVRVDKFGREYFWKGNQNSIDWVQLISSIIEQINQHTSLENFNLNFNLRLEAGMIYVYPFELEDLESELGVMFGLQIDELMDKYHNACIDLDGHEFENVLNTMQNELVCLIKPFVLDVLKSSPQLNLIVYTDIDFNIIEQLSQDK